MIEVKNIKKSFGDKVVIEDVSAVMKAGQCNLIIYKEAGCFDKCMWVVCTR
jgi:ABC-type enterochelin transport system ATPase subunit